MDIIFYLIGFWKGIGYETGSCLGLRLHYPSGVTGALNTTALAFLEDKLGVGDIDILLLESSD